ncbi:MAG: MobF family relaxase [Solirubrobacteraceae bacterium]
MSGADRREDHARFGGRVCGVSGWQGAASRVGRLPPQGWRADEAPGRWTAGAERFGLDRARPVTGEQLRVLMDVRRPGTGEPLRRVGATGEAVAALDATFSAPKSVTAVWAIADPQLRERIETAHETAIDRALSYATRQVPMLRRRISQDTVVHEKAAGLVATSWRHSTARAVAEQAPDPQLHSHVLLHAAVRRDGELVAIDSRSCLVHQREVGAAYRTELARELTELGFGIRRGVGRGGRYFELEGVPQALLDRWSSRRHQVQAAIRDRLADQHEALAAIVAEAGQAASEAEEHLELLERSGHLSPKEERWMATATRNAKQPVTAGDLDTAWRRTALAVGLSRERIEVLRHHAHARVEAAGPGEVLEALTEFDATFPARAARAVALERSAGAPIPAALDQLRALRASQDIVVLADGTGTTQEHRGRERSVIQITQRLTASRIEPLPNAAAAREADRLDRELAKAGGRLSEEQRAAIGRACGEHRLVVIEGQAGTGKSTTLTAIARAHQACGRKIVVTSTAALAAERLANELAERGVSCRAFSTAGLHARIIDGRVELTRDTTVIHDEAALASTREQIRLLRAVEASGARLIAVGDPRQNQPVGAGGLWTRIEDTTRRAGAHAELTRNQRARDPADRRDQAQFREGRAELAVRGYAARDRLHIHPDQQLAEDQALDAARADRTSGRTTIVIAQTSNEHLDELNARAQAIRQQHGQLGDDAIPGPRLALRTTRRRRRPGPPHHPSPRPRTPSQRHHRRHRARRPGIEQPRSLPRRRHRTAAPQGRARPSRPPSRLRPTSVPSPRAHHRHRPSDCRGGREGTYVALTRARDETHIYTAEAPDRPAGTDRLQDLADQISRTEPELPSIQTPLAHETTIIETPKTTEAEAERGHDRTHQEILPTPEAEPRPPEPEPVREVTRDTNSLEPAQSHSAEVDEEPARSWPMRPRPGGVPQLALEELEQDQTLGWEA